ncbi:hypothetical protein KUX74_22765, partial [Salmonella enterica subsp. enterica serovar Montevideo]|nr:hypothetical protein [Salmonella enterica subsp. enterica serovar Montevideo]
YQPGGNARWRFAYRAYRIDISLVVMPDGASLIGPTKIHRNILTVSDPFLGQYQQLVRDVVIPYQWDALNDRIPEAEPSHAIEN